MVKLNIIITGVAGRGGTGWRYTGDVALEGDWMSGKRQRKEHTARGSVVTQLRMAKMRRIRQPARAKRILCWPLKR